MSLYQIFLDNSGKSCQKWAHYFSIYETHLSRFRNQAITLYEIGVFRGGSLPLWKKWLGPLATIVGLDINPECRQFEERDCHIRIGSQSDQEFLTGVLTEFGPPDVVIDDGSHMQTDMMSTFAFLYPSLTNNGVYLIEDTHACYLPQFGGGLQNPASFIEQSKKLIDQLHAWYYRDKDDISYFTKNTWSITYYDSIIVFEKKRKGAPCPVIRPPEKRSG